MQSKVPAIFYIYTYTYHCTHKTATNAKRNVKMKERQKKKKTAINVIQNYGNLNVTLDTRFSYVNRVNSLSLPAFQCSVKQTMNNTRGTENFERRAKKNNKEHCLAKRRVHDSVPFGLPLRYLFTIFRIAAPFTLALAQSDPSIHPRINMCVNVMHGVLILGFRKQ